MGACGKTTWHGVVSPYRVQVSLHLIGIIVHCCAGGSRGGWCGGHCNGNLSKVEKLAVKKSEVPCCPQKRMHKEAFARVKSKQLGDGEGADVCRFSRARRRARRRYHAWLVRRRDRQGEKRVSAGDKQNDALSVLQRAGDYYPTTPRFACPSLPPPPPKSPQRTWL